MNCLARFYLGTIPYSYIYEKCITSIRRRSLLSRFPPWNKPRHLFHILAVLITENSQIPPFLDEHAEEKITIGKDGDRKSIDCDVRVESDNHESG
jgi:hypothetical protein